MTPITSNLNTLKFPLVQLWRKNSLLHLLQHIKESETLQKTEFKTEPGRNSDSNSCQGQIWNHLNRGATFSFHTYYNFFFLIVSGFFFLKGAFKCFVTWRKTCVLFFIFFAIEWRHSKIAIISFCFCKLTSACNCSLNGYSIPTRSRRDEKWPRASWESIIPANAADLFLPR